MKLKAAGRLLWETQYLVCKGEAALVGAELHSGRGGRQRHDTHQCTRHQGFLQVNIVNIVSIIFSEQLPPPLSCLPIHSMTHI